MKKVLLICTAAALLAGCETTSLSGDSYARTQTRQMQTVLEGTLISVRAVKISGTQTGTGVLAGAALGGVAGGGVGRGYGSVAAAVVGAVAGGVIGNTVEEKVTAKNGIELTVRLQQGNTVAIVQEVSQNEVFRPGDRVHILYNANGEARVAPVY